MYLGITICIAFLIAGTIPAVMAEDAPLRKQSITQLENRLDAIDTELEQLAKPSLRSGTGSLGYISELISADDPTWIKIEFERAVAIDQIVLVPILWRDTQKGFMADSFPAEFRITVGTDDDKTGIVIGEYSAADGVLPRVAPYLIPVSDTTASWIRIDITRLSPLMAKNRLAYQLSEILVFSGDENVALRCPVSVSRARKDNPNIWRKEFLTDGLMPYIMDAARGAQIDAYISPPHKNPEMTIDLGKPVALSRIHLHAMDQGNTAPIAIPSNYGFPKHLIIEGAADPSFSDPIKLLEFRYQEANQIGPIMMWNIPKVTCRYVRIRAPSTKVIQMGFSEIELFSNGVNVARDKLVRVNSGRKSPRPLSALTDGFNFYGEILPIRGWMEQLARRHDLEIERPSVTQELSRKYLRQKTNLRRMYWLAALLAAGIAVSILIERKRHLNQIARIKERFAADLHDELGANLHTIGLLSELIKNKTENLPKDVSKFLQRIENVTKRSSLAIRHVTELQTAKGFSTDLSADMKRAAERIVVDLKHTLTIEGEPILIRLKPRTRANLFLFYKECLINICRHAGATEISTSLTASTREIRLIVTDNGRGFPKSVEKGFPASLKRRAKLLAAKLTIESSDSNGTHITLRLGSVGRLRYPFIPKYGTYEKTNPNHAHRGSP